jgi:hypothetical protein
MITFLEFIIIINMFNTFSNQLKDFNVIVCGLTNKKRICWIFIYNSSLFISFNFNKYSKMSSSGI